MTDEFLTVEEVSDRLKVTTRTVRDWIKAGRLHARKAGRQWRIRASDLDGFLEGTQDTPAPDTPQQRRASILARVRTLRSEGLTTQAIAIRLSADGVATISGRGTWQKGTVANLLAEEE